MKLKRNRPRPIRRGRPRADVGQAEVEAEVAVLTNACPIVLLDDLTIEHIEVSALAWRMILETAAQYGWVPSGTRLAGERGSAWDGAYFPAEAQHIVAEDVLELRRALSKAFDDSVPGCVPSARARSWKPAILLPELMVSNLRSYIRVTQFLFDSPIILLAHEDDDSEAADLPRLILHGAKTLR